MSENIFSAVRELRNTHANFYTVCSHSLTHCHKTLVMRIYDSPYDNSGGKIFAGSFCRYRSTDYVSLRKTKEIKDKKQNNSK